MEANNVGSSVATVSCVSMAWSLVSNGAGRVAYSMSAIRMERSKMLTPADLPQTGEATTPQLMNVKVFVPAFH
jgi:hypothetical protein